jgi:dTDP-glucose 4,6-dehydratase
MSWKDRSVLITGAGGFIGSHLTESLAGQGADVRAFVRYNSRNDRGMLEMLDPGMLDGIDVVMGDLRDSGAIRKAVKGVDTIFHLGALIAIPYSYLHPRETILTNIEGTMNVLDAAMDVGVRRMVHTSTSETYGTAQYVPIDEKHPMNPQSPYAASKAGADYVALSYHRSYELPVAVLRPFNTYGPRQSMRAIIPTIIVQALKGDVVKLGTLDSTRDLTYVGDTVNGFLKVAESDAAIGEVINVGNNLDISIGDLANRIIKIIGREVRIVQEEKRMRPPKSEVMRLRASNEKAKQLIGWEPEVSIDQGLKSTVDWISDNLELYRARGYVV